MATKFSKGLRIQVTPRMLEKLKAAAQDEEMTTSEWIRWAIRDKLKENRE